QRSATLRLGVFRRKQHWQRCSGQALQQASDEIRDGFCSVDGQDGESRAAYWTNGEIRTNCRKINEF
ncbi:unnamed protein product, partial [Linum tenue]